MAALPERGCVADQRQHVRTTERLDILPSPPSLSPLRLEGGSLLTIYTDAEQLAGRAKGDARKIRFARRLRAETAVTLQWIAAALHMGTWTHVAIRLFEKPAQTKHQPNLMLCQK